MDPNRDGAYDELLLLVIGSAGLALLALFALTPVLRVYYALLMPAVITLGAGVAWLLLRRARVASRASGDASRASGALTDRPDGAADGEGLHSPGLSTN